MSRTRTAGSSPASSAAREFIPSSAPRRAEPTGGSADPLNAVPIPVLARTGLPPLSTLPSVKHEPDWLTESDDAVEQSHKRFLRGLYHSGNSSYGVRKLY